MKIRTDFVTNSSSSSFIAYGVSGYDGDELEISTENLRNFLKESNVEDVEQAMKEIENDEEDYGKVGMISEFAYDHPMLEICSTYAGEGFAVGIPLSKLLTHPDTAEMKVKDLKEFVLGHMKLLYPDMKLEDVQYIEEVWHD